LLVSQYHLLFAGLDVPTLRFLLGCLTFAFGLALLTFHCPSQPCLLTLPIRATAPARTRHFHPHREMLPVTSMIVSQGQAK
jgi:hypothetical protein